MDFPQLAPTADTTPVGDLARQLTSLVGPAVQAPDGSAAGAEYMALAQSLQDARLATINALGEAFVDTAVALLSEHEDEYGLPSRPDASPASRQAALLARVRGYAGSPQRLTRSLATLLGATTITETALPAAGVPRDVFRFTATMLVAQVADTVLLQQVNDQLQVQSPAHTNWSITPI